MDTTITRFRECNGGPHAWHPWIQFEKNPHEGKGQCPWCAEIARREERERRRGEVLCGLGNTL